MIRRILARSSGNSGSSSMMIRFLVAPAAVRRGPSIVFLVSSVIERITFPILEISLAMRTPSSDLAPPGRPAIRVIAPHGILSFQSHLTGSFLILSARKDTPFKEGRKKALCYFLRPCQIPSPLSVPPSEQLVARQQFQTLAVRVVLERPRLLQHVLAGVQRGHAQDAVVHQSELV